MGAWGWAAKCSLLRGAGGPAGEGTVPSSHPDVSLDPKSLQHVACCWADVHHQRLWFSTQISGGGACRVSGCCVPAALQSPSWDLPLWVMDFPPCNLFYLPSGPNPPSICRLRSALGAARASTARSLCAGLCDGNKVSKDRGNQRQGSPLCLPGLDPERLAGLRAGVSSWGCGFGRLVQQPCLGAPRPSPPVLAARGLSPGVAARRQELREGRTRCCGPWSRPQNSRTP